jgi:hypothetical protein
MVCIRRENGAEVGNMVGNRESYYCHVWNMGKHRVGGRGIALNCLMILRTSELIEVLWQQKLQGRPKGNRGRCYFLAVFEFGETCWACDTCTWTGM